METEDGIYVKDFIENENVLDKWNVEMEEYIEFDPFEWLLFIIKNK